MNLIENAWAQGAPAGQPSAFVQLLPLIVLFAVFYFLIIRPQMKRQKEHRKMVQELGKGDEVVTNGGVLGRIVGLDDQFITLKVAAGTEIKVQRHAIGAVMPKGTFKD